MKIQFEKENIFYVVIAMMPLYLVRFGLFNIPTNILEIAIILCSALWLAGNYKNLRLKDFFIPKFLVIGITLIIAGAILSIAGSDDMRTGLGILKGWFLLPIFFSWLFFSTLKKEAGVEKTFLAIYFSATVVSVISLGYKLSDQLTFDGRLSAFYLSPNYLAMFVTPGIIFGLFLFADSFLQSKFSKKTILYAVSLSILLLTLYFTYSYGSWIALSASVFIAFSIYLPRKKLFMGTMFLIILLGATFFTQANSQHLLSIIQGDQRSSLSSRKMIWQASFEMLRQHPFVGIGPGNFQQQYLLLQKDFPPYLEWAVPQPHNIFLAFWLQTGLLGLTGFVLLMIVLIKNLFLLLKNKKGQPNAGPLFVFFIYTAICGMIDTPYWKNDLSFLFWICVFATIFLLNQPTQKSE